MTELFKLIVENKILGQPYIYILIGILLLIYLINYIKKPLYAVFYLVDLIFHDQYFLMAFVKRELNKLISK